jgi:predicted O-methyltransferase YrrM
MALLQRLSSATQRLFAEPPPDVRPPCVLPVHWVRRDGASWLAARFRTAGFEPVPGEHAERIEALARQTQALGAQPLWEGYAGHNRGGATRSPDEVRTAAAMGNAYTFLVRRRRPGIVVEFGTAFGVSGMYFLAGLEANDHGRLLTFEPNATWAGIARDNLAQIGERFELTVGTFEEHVDRVLPPGERIDMAFVDAIHTRAFVLPQLEIVLARAAPGAIVILDDIDFSDDMRACWHDVARDRRFRASLALGERVGVVELR